MRLKSIVRRIVAGCIVVVTATLTAGCGTPAPASTVNRDLQLPPLKPVKLASGEKLKVLATTSILGDVVANVGGNAIALTTLMGPGQDPHAFQPTPQDIAAVESAQVVFVNGFNLEEALITTIDASASKGQPVISASAGIHPRQLQPSQSQTPATSGTATVSEAGADPHVWFDPANVKVWTSNIETSLKALNPANAATYTANAAAYQQQLDALDTYIQAQVAKIPPDRRKLVTDHDAFGYFAARYGFQIIGAVVPTISTTAEPSAGELADLVARIRAAGVPAIFVGTTVNPKMADLVAQETGARIVSLYTGELGGPGTGAETYIGMMKSDVQAIVSALAQ